MPGFTLGRGGNVNILVIDPATWSPRAGHSPVVGDIAGGQIDKVPAVMELIFQWEDTDNYKGTQNMPGDI